MGKPKVPNHAHCVNCRKAVPPGEETCSTECADEVESQEDRRKKMMWLMYGLIGVGFLIAVVGPALFQ
jgi:predicted nucleic acid-binding Zn ribbon protein